MNADIFMMQDIQKLIPKNTPLEKVFNNTIIKT